MKLTLLLPLFLSSLGALAQSNGCNAGYFPGNDTVIYTTPYTYQQVLSIIGSYKNISWSGSPADTVTLNGSDNTVGTSRTYDIAGAHVVETITIYQKPANGPYYEVHTLAPLVLPLPGFNLSLYGDYDGTTVTPICDGKASKFNFTINFCANNASVAAAALHMIHLTDAQTVGKFLGDENFTNCEALAGGSSSTTSASVPAFTGRANVLGYSSVLGAVALAAFMLSDGC